MAEPISRHNVTEEGQVCVIASLLYTMSWHTQLYNMIALRRVTLLYHSYAVVGQRLGQILVSSDNTNVGHGLYYVTYPPSLVLL